MFHAYSALIEKQKIYRKITIKTNFFLKIQNGAENLCFYLLKTKFSGN